MPTNRRVCFGESSKQEYIHFSTLCHAAIGMESLIKQNLQEHQTSLTAVQLTTQTDVDKEQMVEFYASLPSRCNHESFIKNAVQLILEKAVFQGTDRESRVIEWMEPERLRNAINMKLNRNGATHDELLQLADDVIRYSVKTGHPYFVNQLFSSLDPYGLVGQWLTDALNPSVYTYEVSPVFSLMEQQVLEEMRELVGWERGEGDGIFCPGGSVANGYAINLARHRYFPQIKHQGMSLMSRLIIFTSEDAHYSIQKLAAFVGIGVSNVYRVLVDERGKMRVDDLEKQVQRALEEGAVPLMVAATAGTTVLGAFDPLSEIASIAKKYRMWFHVDAAWGGGVLLSRKHRSLLNGVHLADSVTWNPHKLLTAPQQCSTLLLRCKDNNLLQSAHGANASYLFQKDKFYDTSYDSGDKHIQCGRKADVLKFWYMWKAKGTDGLERHVDRVFELSRHFTSLIRNREGWTLLMEPECTNVCFWYTPHSKRHLRDSALSEALHKVAPVIKERMVRKGSMLITYQPLRERPNFFRLVLQNSGLRNEDMMYFVQEIEQLSQDL